MLSEAELKKLSQVISDVEKSTAGELRLIIARRSSRGSHIFPLLAFALATMGLLYLWHSRHLILLGSTAWLTPGILLAAAVVAFLLSRLPVVQRRLTWDLEEQVMVRAELEFHREGLGNTQGKTGILIFLSMLEHQAVVLADKAIAQKLEPKVWSDVVNLVIEGARKKTLATSLEAAIRRCGALLAQHFPIQAGDKNELPNHVLIKD